MGMPVIIPGTVTRAEAVGDIIESVAMEESAFAHILNAESEKLMKVIENSASTVEELMGVNRSVRMVVKSITRLEMYLEAKLKLFDATICEK